MRDPSDEAWLMVFNGGPMALSKAHLDDLEPKLSATGKAVLRHLFDGIERQAIHYERLKCETEHDAMRIRKIGRTMHEAGLKSYVDEKGRVYTAP